MSLNLDNDLLAALFETISNEVHIYEAMRSPDHGIIDFRSLVGKNATNGKPDTALFQQ